MQEKEERNKQCYNPFLKKFACLLIAVARDTESAMNNPSSYTIEQQTNPHQHTKPQTNTQQTPQDRGNY
jgi:hypothetical protein